MAAQQPPATPPVTRSIGRALLWPAAAVGLGFLLVFNSLNPSGQVKPPAAAAAASVAPAPAGPTSAAPSASPALLLPRSVPKRILIPEIDVDAPFTQLSIGKSGALDAPPENDSNLAGWFKGGVTPGERGTAIVAGHVDTKTGPAVFLELSSLKPGSTVDIARADGSVATFKVDSVETFEKKNFPNERVYADTASPQLRVLTCGGSYDKKNGYTDNVVVFAHLDKVKRAGA
ncbi:class F sortase [Streptomyces sp. NBC_00390]|uniref:class F sortase n=1 Tax=Streptomyces sp. NBC_00390 TaxID=2975736 RepID=UPI002E1D4EC2